MLHHVLTYLSSSHKHGVMFQVINESLRITTTVPVVLRKPDHDIQVGDYTIPAGWTFMGYPNVHFNPEKYEDPFVFNPWRWKVI